MKITKNEIKTVKKPHYDELPDLPFATIDEEGTIRLYVKAEYSPLNNGTQRLWYISFKESKSYIYELSADSILGRLNSGRQKIINLERITLDYSREE